MIGKVAHIGLTVSDIEKSIEFYKNILGLKFQGKMIMEGENAERLFNIKDCKVRVAYLNGSEEINTPPIELIQFEKDTILSEGIKLNKVSISEVCFSVSDIEKVYDDLSNKGVEFLSKPQYFDLRDQGFGESKAVYFKDPDGIILELIEDIRD